MLATVADEQDAAVVELGAAVRAAAEPVVRVVGLEDRAGIPVGALDHPRHHVLQAAEDGLAFADRFGRAEALALGDLDAAPAAWTRAHTSANRLRERSGGPPGRY